MRLKAPFETSFGVTQDRRIVLVEVIADGVSGWGEVTTIEAPSYNSETTDTAWHIISDFIAPLLVGKDLPNGTDVPQLLAAIRGHQMAKAGIENAIWDAEAQQKGIPLATMLGGTAAEIACGVSLGIRESPLALVKKVEEELSSGYQRIKLKIKPGKDLDFVAAVRKQFPAILLSIRTAICLDECIQNAGHANAAIQLGACRIINIKLGRVGGHSAARNVHDVCRKHSVPVWCGGMLESGIGRAHNIAMSTLPGFALPGDVSASQRYWDQDIIEPEVEVTPHGTIRVPTAPGLGYSVNRDLIDRLKVRSRNWKAEIQVGAE